MEIFLFEVNLNLGNEKFCVLEIKISNSSHPTEKGDLWFHVDLDSNKIERLVLVSQREEDVQGKLMNVRIFEKAELRFDKTFGRFISNTHEHILMNCAASALSAEVKKLIENYLK